MEANPHSVNLTSTIVGIKCNSTVGSGTFPGVVDI